MPSPFCALSPRIPSRFLRPIPHMRTPSPPICTLRLPTLRTRPNPSVHAFSLCAHALPLPYEPYSLHRLMPSLAPTHACPLYNPYACTPSIIPPRVHAFSQPQRARLSSRPAHVPSCPSHVPYPKRARTPSPLCTLLSTLPSALSRPYACTPSLPPPRVHALSTTPTRARPLPTPACGLPFPSRARPLSNPQAHHPSNPEVRMPPSRLAHAPLLSRARLLPYLRTHSLSPAQCPSPAPTRARPLSPTPRRALSPTPRCARPLLVPRTPPTPQAWMASPLRARLLPYPRTHSLSLIRLAISPALRRHPPLHTRTPSLPLPHANTLSPTSRPSRVSSLLTSECVAPSSRCAYACSLALICPFMWTGYPYPLSLHVPLSLPSCACPPPTPLVLCTPSSHYTHALYPTPTRAHHLPSPATIKRTPLALQALLCFCFLCLNSLVCSLFVIVKISTYY